MKSSLTGKEQFEKPRLASSKRQVSKLAVISLLGAGLFLANTEAYAQPYTIGFGQESLPIANGAAPIPWGIGNSLTPLITVNGVNQTGPSVVTTNASGNQVPASDPNANQVLRLTTNGPSQSGSAFFINPTVLGNNSDFAAQFTFQISSPTNSIPYRSDGLAFVVATNTQALGGGGESMGYGDNTGGNGGFSHSAIVEFDTYQNGFDPSDSHVALMTNGDENKHLAYANTPSNWKLDNGDVWNALIRYYGQGNLLIVNLYDVLNPQASKTFFSTTIDIPQILGCGPYGCVNSYFGLTAGTGGGYANHDILSFALQVPEPEDLFTFAFGLGVIGLLQKNRKLNGG